MTTASNGYLSLRAASRQFSVAEAALRTALRTGILTTHGDARSPGSQARWKIDPADITQLLAAGTIARTSSRRRARKRRVQAPRGTAASRPGHVAGQRALRQPGGVVVRVGLPDPAVPVAVPVTSGRLALLCAVGVALHAAGLEVSAERVRALADQIEPCLT